MEVVYVAIGVVDSMFLGVNGVTKKVEEVEEIDVKEEHNEEI